MAMDGPGPDPYLYIDKFDAEDDEEVGTEATAWQKARHWNAAHLRSERENRMDALPLGACYLGPACIGLRSLKTVKTATEAK